MDNFRKRQTYYGFVNLIDGKFQVYEYERGNGVYTVDFLKKVMAIFEGKQIWMLWDGATYHKGNRQISQGFTAGHGGDQNTVYRY